VRICRGRRFQADGATTEKELFESWRLDRGTIKSPRDVDRSRVSEHSGQSSTVSVNAGCYVTCMVGDDGRYHYRCKSDLVGLCVHRSCFMPCRFTATLMTLMLLTMSGL